MSESPIRDFLVGVFVLMGLAAIAYMSVALGGASYRGPGGLQLIVTFDQVGGLKPRSRVVVGGVKVGQISGISLDENLRARVVIDIDERLELPTDTSAAILTSGVLGNQYIELEPGGEEAILKPGDEIEFTQSALILEQMISRLVQNLGVDSPE
ncbi:MAG: outer membrane lipid asymmetry maintenance protein MlaD [Deltaproteobacteria bacterium]|nr:outer membrane lipid asymmetry maintenance protein MlaD [Deltaproteobacteria bacterium]MCZ6714194.1 outer membrane lipid asymmetry maintenance protein MlaD [Deltaproteobacteria bacterium]